MARSVGISIDATSGDPIYKQIADQIAPLMKEARSKRFDFLAYLLAMALREARRLSGA